MIFKVVLQVVTLLSLVLVVMGDGHAISEQKIVKHHRHGEISHIGLKEPEHHDEYAPSYPSYEFSYKVDDPHTHDVKGQSESRDGDEVTGEYYLYEPDGRKRTVKYHADKHTGFKAQVEYSAPHHHIHPKTPHEEDEPQDKLHHEEAASVPEEIAEPLKYIPSLHDHKYEVKGYHPRDYRRKQYRVSQ